MPGPRDKRIREAYLKHIQTLKKSKTNGITEHQAENLINSFDRQAEASDILPPLKASPLKRGLLAQ